MNPERLNTEKRRAELLRTLAAAQDDNVEAEYWHAYRLGLAAAHQHEAAILAGIGSEDASRDARGRGYRDARAWLADREAASHAARALGRLTSPRKAAAVRRNGRLGGRPRKPPPEPDTPPDGRA